MAAATEGPAPAPEVPAVDQEVPDSELPLPLPESPAAVPVRPTEPPPPSPAPPPVAPLPAPANAPALVTAPVPATTVADWTLVPGKNALMVVVTYQRGTLGANLAHDHAIVATRYGGTVRWDPNDPGACAISVDVPTSGLRVDPPGARARAGLDGEPVVEDHPKIEENFNGGQQLDSERFPVLTFRSTGCAPADGGRTRVSGDLVIHGVTRPTEVLMEIGVEGDQLRAKGSFVAGHRDFGMKPFAAALGAVKNAEPLTFVLDLTARRQ